MYYLIMIAAALMWSTIGILVKSAGLMVNSTVITFCRFSIGILFLGICLLIRDKKISIYFKNYWIWFGLIGKVMNYLFENLGVMLGSAAGNIVISPVQTVFMTMVSVVLFHERLTLRKITAIILCIVGVLTVSINGQPISNYLDMGLGILLLFIFAGIGAGAFVIAQKRLIDKVDSMVMNFSMFLIGSLITAVPLPFTGEIYSGWLPLSILAILALGFITAFSFQLNCLALKKISFIAVTLITSTSPLFTLLWVSLFFGEPITPFIIWGVLLFITGLLFISLPEGTFRKILHIDFTPK